MSLRLFGLALLTFAIGVSSCQALFPRGSDQETPRLPPGYGEGRSQ